MNKIQKRAYDYRISWITGSPTSEMNDRDMDRAFQDGAEWVIREIEAKTSDGMFLSDVIRNLSGEATNHD